MNAPSRPSTRRRQIGGAKRRLFVSVAVGALALPTVAAAAVSPGHSVVTGSTDELVILEGYAAAAGPVTIDVTRGGIRIGTTGPMAVPAGGIIEINHPVDVGQTPDCWRGHTPDIGYGDEIRVTQGASVETSRVRNVTVSDPVADGPMVVEVHGSAPEGATRLPVGELGVRLINPAFQGVSGGGPFVEAPDFGTLTYDAPSDPTNPNWTARFDFTGIPVAYNAALSPETGTEAGWLVEAAATEGTEVGVTPEPLEPGLVGCPEPLGTYAVTMTTPNVVTNATPQLNVSGAAPLGATSVEVTLSDGNPLTSDVTAPGTFPGPTDVGGRIWSASFTNGQLLDLDVGTLTATPRFQPGNVVGVARTLAKSADGALPVQFDSGPAEGSTSSTGDATFTFSSPVSDASFECALDGQAFAPCGSPRRVDGLLNGSHTFAIRAVDGATPSATATRTWNVLLPGPDTTFTSTPPPATLSRSATFAFTSPVPVAGFQCSLDGAAFATCTSPTTLTTLTVGNHTFRVRAVENTGTPDATPASYTWTVTPPDTERPRVTNSVGPVGKLTFARNGALVINARCDERCTMIAKATLIAPNPVRRGSQRAFTLRSKTVDSAAGATSRLRLALSARQLRIVRNSLRAGKKVRVTVTVIGTDASGNASNALRTLVLTKKNL